MPDLKQKIKDDLNEALKKGEDLAVSSLRMVLAAVQNKELAAKENKALKDEEVLDIIFSEIKKRKESIAAFEKGNRQDLAEKEEKEMKILGKYLPEQMSSEELKKIIQTAVKKSGAKEIKDMGKVMAELMPKVKGKADMGLVSKIVKEALSAKS